MGTRVATFFEVAGYNAAVAVAGEDGGAEGTEAGGGSCGGGDIVRGEESGYARGARRLRSEWHKEGEEEIGGDGFEGTEDGGALCRVWAEPSASKLEYDWQSARVVVSLSREEEAMEDHPDNIGAASWVWTVFHQRPEKVVEIDLTAAVRIVLIDVFRVVVGGEEEPGRFAIIHDLMVEEVSFVNILAGRVGRGECEVEDVLEGALVAQLAVGCLWGDRVAGGGIALARHCTMC